MPNQSERAKILKGENVEENIDYEYVAALCQGFSGSDLLELCKQAAYFPVRELLHDEKNGKASSATFTDILKRLATHYKTDLSPQKASIKLMIQEELTKLAKAEEDEDDDDEEEPPNAENVQMKKQKVA